MILTYSFSPKIQIDTNTPKDFAECLRSYARDFDEISKIKDLKKICDDPVNHEWQTETEDPDQIKKLKLMGFAEPEDFDEDLN
jgi:hypothetical protein